MNKQIIAAILAALVLYIAMPIAAIENDVPTTTSEAYIPSEYTKEELNIKIAEQEDKKDSAHKMAEAARELDNDDVIAIAKEEWNNAQEQIISYEQQIKEIEIYEAQLIEQEKWNKRYQEYPIATQVWQTLKSWGYNDYVTAGIIGNMMAEVGGQTLNLDYQLSDKSGMYYGLCQWYLVYNPIWGIGFEAQMDLLQETIEREINVYGYFYYQGFNYSAFLNLQNEVEAADAFARCYERCGAAYYAVRHSNAVIAYNYFVN